MKQSTFSAVMANSIKNLLQGYTKGIRFVAILTMLLMLGIGQAWGATITFKTNNSDSSTALDASNFTGEVTAGAEFISSVPHLSKVYAGKSGLKFGSSSAIGNVTINLATTAQITNPKITIKSTKYSSDTGKFDIYINGSSTSSAQATPGTDLTFTYTGKITSIKIATTTKRAYLNSIIIESSATNFTVGETVFIQALSSSAWDASACVKAWFNGNNTAATTYWLYDATGSDAGKKMFATIVPTGTSSQVQIQRFAPNCNDWWNSNGDLKKSDGANTNILQTNGSGTNNVAWNSGGLQLYLYGTPNSWASSLATFSDKSNGVWTATYSNYSPTTTSADFKIKDSYNGWIGNTGSNDNATLSGLVVGSTYDITATLDIKDHSLTLSKELKKCQVHFDMNGHGADIASKTNVTPNSTITAPTEPTDADYKFEGWYKESSCTNQWNFATDEVTETMTLYAKWTKKVSYTITWKVNNNDYFVGTPTTSIYEGSTYQDLTLPTDPEGSELEACYDNKVFVGWSTHDLGYAETTEPVDLFTSDNVPDTEITENKTFYAVFATETPGTAGDPEWLETGLANITASDVVVITMTYTTDGTVYALSSANGSSSAPTATIVTVSNGALSTEPIDALQWNISNNSGTLTIYPNGTTETWLYCTNTNNGVRVGTNANSAFTIDATSGYLINTATSRYVGVYRTNPDWRCYDNTTGNTANQTLKFYKETSTASPASYSGYVSKCYCVTGIALSMTGEHKNLDVGETNQLLVTYTPANATCDTEIVSWTSSNNNILSVSNTGLVTANMAGEATITATTEGGVTATYTITVNNPDCEAWYIHYWNNSTSGDECFYKVKPDDPNDHEWRTNNFSLPSFSNEDMFIVNNAQTAGGDSQKTDQVFRTDIGFADIQRGGQNCGTNPYPGQDAYGQLSIYDDSNSPNRYIAFYPAQYMVTFGKEGSSWEEMPLNNTTGYEYESEPFMVPNGYKTDDTYKYWVGITDKNGNIKYVGYEFDGVEYKKSSVDAMNTVNGLSAEDMAGKWGVWHIWSNSCANNWYAEFIRYYRVDFYLNGGEGDIAPRYGKAAEPYATFSTTDITAPTRDEHTFLGWKDQKGNSYNPTESTVTINDDLTLTAQWQINQYTVTLNPNYPNGKTGTFTYDAGELVDGNLVLTYDYNTASMTIEDLYTSLTLDGYEFGGWYNAKGLNPGEVSGSKCTTTGTITGNKTYFAKWTKLYSITLSENGTTTTPTTQTSTSYTLPTELSVGTCENDEKELVGWSTVAIPNPGDKPTSNFYELGETVTLTADQTTFYAVFATAEGGGVENVDATLSFESTEQRTIFNTSQQVWTQNGITLTNNKASSTSNVSDYSNPARFYKSSDITITAPGNITQIVFTCNTGAYATSLAKSIDDANLASETIVTLILDGTSDSYEVTLSNGQVRMDSLTVTYTTGNGTSYSEYTTACVKLPDPVLSFATEPANPIVFTDAVCGGNSSKQSVTVVGENLRDVVNVSVTGPYKIARTASTALKDFTTSLTLDKTAAGAIHSNYQTVYIISTPPAQSTEATTGTLTFTTTKGNTLIVNLSTPTVTCTQYTLTLVDRGVSTEQPTKYYAGETIDEAPADPEGVCTDPIHYVFDGWAVATVAAGSTTYTKVTFPYTVEGNTKFYAVYRYVEDGGADSGDYVKVTENLDDYSGDYLFVYETGNVAFDGGRNNVDDELDATSNTIEVTIDNNTIASNATTDAAKFTIAKVDGGYSIQSASGYYIGRSATSNGLSTNETYSANYDLNTITDCKTIKGKGGNILKYNKTSDQKRFRYYKSGQEDIALYRKAASYLYTTSPVCGPHLVVTEGKDIYVTGGNAGGTRDLVIAQQKVSYKATRLQTSNGLVDGTAPDVKVATNGITIGGVVTQDVKVTIDQTKEQQTDGTYTITGTITVQYQPSANNKQEDIRVQLAVDYNAEARDNFTVHARSLPAEFVIVAKSGDKWYALNGDMNTNAANPANGQVTLDNDDNPTKATYAPCNTIYTFDGLPNTGDRTYVRFQGTDGAWLWASSGTNVGIQNNVLKTTPEGNNNAYNWKLYTEDNITYRFGNANSSRQLTLNGEKFGMYASGVQDIRILPYVEKCLYNYAPSNLKVSVLKGTYVTLTWDAVAGATKYQYSTNGTTWTDAGTEPTVTINGLIGDTEYTYYIRAYHEDAGVTNECIDYAEITFTTANCDDVPTNITYTADLNSITVSWTAAAPTATITYNTKEDGTGGGGIINNATSPCRISGGLDKNTTYYIQILADGTCASPIIPVKTEDVEVDIVEWDPQGIIVDINTDETIGVTLENEVSYGSGLGSLAEDLFFSKYFEGSGSLKMIAIYNGTGKDVDLSEYRIDRGSNGDATNISKTYDLSQLGIIKQGQEIIFYSWPLTSEYSYSCSQSFLDSKVQESGLDANPRWILCDAKTHNGIEFEAMDFSGNDPLLLYKSSELIDVFGVSTEQESPASTQICSGRSDQAWSADGVTNMDYGKTTEDFPNGEIPHGVNVDDETITAYTARVIMFRKNTVVSGKNAVTKNTTTFATFAEEWEARQVCMSGDDGDLTCAAYQELGTFDYSDYYTKYESMGEGTTFEENDRNPDGTVTIPITDLYKHACSNIRVKLTNSNGDVLTDREYKVPIMITTPQGTDGQTFLDLQQNLATKEVDDEGNVIRTHPLSLEEVREICKTCDVVVRDNATLTKVTDGTTNDHPQVHDVIVYEGASIVIPDGTDHNYTINSLALRRKGDDVASAQVQGTGKFVLPADVPVTLSMRIDANNWHWFTLPYDCDIAKVTWSDGTPAKYNTDWFLMYYDGESRAASTNPYDNHWKVYSGTTIEAGKGYILGITGNLAHPNYTFELCFPMAQGVLTAEQTKKTVALNAWGVKSDNTPNNLGWNLVGNPYLDYYKTSENISFTGLSLLKYTGIDPVTGERLYDDSGNVPFLVTPVDGGWYEYQQELASEVEMMPFTAYFVQVGDPNNLDHTDGMELHAQFESDHRGRMSLIRRAPQEVDGEQEPVIVRVEVANAKGESDKTTLIIDDRFTNEYEMNGDFFKWFGDYYRRYTKPVLYSMGADQGKRAFNALSEQLAAQPVALGMFAAQAGDYTFSLTRKRCDLSRVEEVWLYDATTATYTNLMQQDYTFTTAKTEGEGRFYLSVKMRQNAPTDITDIYGGNIVASAKDGQIIVGGLTDNTQLWIYDATGKLLHTEHTTNFQHVYDVPVVGTYFVRTQGAGQAQTIKVLVE